VKVARSVAAIREELFEPHRRGERIGLVPTMGALHAGHLALLRAAHDASDVLVMSLFVNPAQFDEAADLARYPRDEPADLSAAEDAGVDLVFAPPVDALYPPGFDTWVDPGELADVLEGAARPGHFRGVATVCTKLFSIVRPTAAYFGQKDAQQLAVIRRVARDLDLPLEIVAVPTVRDRDGLALSSRNAFLSSADRAAALSLPRALEAGRIAHASGADAVAAARSVLDSQPALAIGYVAIAEFDVPTLVAAVRIGATRLIDNVRLGG
jgi:pantoate--beta-alanine ligase